MSLETAARGEPDRYEITWMTGHIETVMAHEVIYPHTLDFLREPFGSTTRTTDRPRFIQMHAELNGRWCLTLHAREEDIRTIRLVTSAEQIPGAES